MRLWLGSVACLFALLVGVLVGTAVEPIDDDIGAMLAVAALALASGFVFWVGVVAIRKIVRYGAPRASSVLVRYIKMHADRYFSRLKFRGFRKATVQIAVACGVTVATVISLAFATKLPWQAIAIILSGTLAIFSVWGWANRGDKLTIPRFLRYFYEPTYAFALPALVFGAGREILTWLGF